MDRRQASKLLLGASIAAPSLILPGKAEATEREAVPTTVLLPLILVLLSGRRFQPAFLVLITSATILTVARLNQPMRRRDIGQADARKVPLIGRLMSQPIQEQVRQAQLLGLFFAVNEYLIFKPFGDTAKAPKSVSFVNQDNHFFSDFRGREQAMSESLARYDFRERDAIGRGYYNAESERLIGAIPPYKGFREPNA